MNIRLKEDQLFATWKKKYPNETFVIDGAPGPESFESSPSRCLIILKDANFDPQEKPEETFDLRKQLLEDPHGWWRTIANWCAGISHIHERKNLTWLELEQEDIKHSLQPFAFMQLKKTVGGGSVDAKVIEDHVERDETEIKKQIDIYQPKAIICCGVGAEMVRVLNSSKWQHTRTGVQYATVDLYGQQTFLIDYMHPSARAAKNIVCFGLLDAYREIVMGS